MTAGPLTEKMLEALQVLASGQVFPDRNGRCWYHAEYVNTRVCAGLRRRGLARKMVRLHGVAFREYPEYAITEEGRQALEDATSGLDWTATQERA